MEKQNKKVVIAIVLCVGAVMSLIYGITAPPKTKRGISQAPKTTHSGDIASSAGKIVPTKRRAERTEFSAWGRNPFSAEEAPKEEVVKLRLNGILWDEKNPQAIIGDDIVGIGDKIGPNTVVDIKEASVILNDGTGNFELNLAW